MKKYLLKKTMVIGIILLLIGTFYLPTISSENVKIKNENTSLDRSKDGIWWHRMKIKINHNMVAGDLNNFPILISIESSHLGKKAQSDGDDIVFTESFNVKDILNHEIELFDSSSGKLVSWVKIPFLSSTQDTVIYMHYGNSKCGNQQSPEMVWDDNFTAVYHLDGVNYLDIKDSTSNNLDVVEKQGYPTFQASGKIGLCVDFDEASLNVDDNDLLSFTDGSNNDKPLTIETWVKYYSAGGGNNGIISKYANMKREWLLRKAGDDKCELYLCDDSIASTIWRKSSSNVNVNNMGWSYIAASYGGFENGNDISIILDGTVNNGETWTGNYHGMENLNEKMRIGAHHSHVNGWSYWQGLIDEVRISNIVRSPEWLQTSYNTMNEPSSFIKAMNIKIRSVDEASPILNIFENHPLLFPIFKLLLQLL